MGDFNFNCFMESSLCCNSKIAEIENSFHPRQIITEPTRVTLTSLMHGTIPKCLADHYGVFVTLSLKLPSPSDTIICTRKSHNINTGKFLNDFAHSYILNEYIFTITVIDFAWQTFKNEFLLMCNEVAPVRHNRIRKKKNIWFSVIICIT